MENGNEKNVNPLDVELNSQVIEDGTVPEDQTVQLEPENMAYLHANNTIVDPNITNREEAKLLLMKIHQRTKNRLEKGWKKTLVMVDDRTSKIHWEKPEVIHL